MPVAVRSVIAFAALLAAACVPPAGPLPEVVRDAPDRGFPTSGSQPTPLSLAVMRDDLAEVERLLSTGADPNERWDRYGDRFPLQEAIHNFQRPNGPAPPNRDAIVETLLAHGADPNARYCHYEGRGSVVDLLLEPTTVYLPYCHSRLATTVLMSAIAFQQPDTISRLLTAGADATVADYADRTALDYTQNARMFELVLAGAFPGPEGERQAAAALRARLDVSLDWIGRRGRYQIWWPNGYPGYGTSRLLFASIGVNPRSDEERRALGWITRLADRNLIKLMVERGLDLNQTRWCQSFEPSPRPGVEGPIDPACTPEQGVTPLMMAAHDGATEWEQWLLDHGADPRTRDWRGWTAADYRKTPQRRAP